MKRILAVMVALFLAPPAYGDPLGSALGGAAGNQSSGAGCIYNSPQLNLSPGQQATLSCDVNGKLVVNATLSASIAISPLTSTNLSSTISVTNTFQPIQVSTGGRNGCLIQNQSTTDPMWVYFGAIGGATKAKSFELDTSHGLAISCSVGGLGVLTDQVSITGTSTDGFTANFQ